MAIQMRRGNGTKFLPSKLLPGEWAIVLDDDPTTGGRAAYICYGSGIVKRMVTEEDMSDEIRLALDDLIAELTDGVEQAVEEAVDAAVDYAEGELDAATANANAAASAAQSAIDAMTGNVLRGTVGPSEVVSADDAYAQTPLGLKVHGNTRQNLWSNPNGTSNGATVTSNEDGSMTVSGTATADADIESGDVYVLKQSTEYAITLDAELSGAEYRVTEYGSDGSQLAQHAVSTASTQTFTTNASISKAVMSMHVPSGTTVSGTYRIMLNEGDTAESWCPPGLNSVSEVSAVLAGKNLLVSEKSTTRNGITYTVNEDGTVDMSGTASYITGFYYPSSSWGNCLLLPKGTYTFSALGVISKTSANIFLKHNPEDESSFLHEVISEDSGSVTFTIDDDCLCIAQFNVEAGTTVDLTFSLQLELGSTATEYEPLNVNTVPIDLKGNELCSLPSGKSNALILGGESGAVIEGDVVSYTFTGNEIGSLLAGAQEGEITQFLISIPYEHGKNATNADFFCDRYHPHVYMFSWSYDKCITFTNNRVYIMDSAYKDFDTFVKSLAGMKIVFQANESQKVQLTPPELPALPAPNLTAYADADVPAEIELEYARDVTLVIGSLEAKVAALELLHETE